MIIKQNRRLLLAGLLSGVAMLANLTTCSSSKNVVPATQPDYAVVDSLSRHDTTAAIPTIDSTESRAYKVVNLFYFTDRNATGSESSSSAYGGERSSLKYGFCRVSIPENHTMGQLEAPSILNWEFSEDPEKHVVLLDARPHTEEDFFSTISAIVEHANKKEAFVFVHGYNVTFRDAARRAAQMAYDLQFTGTPILYSWPSKGSEVKYAADESNIEWTEFHLEKSLIDLMTRSRFETIFLIAHSMGNRALTKVLTRVLPRPEAAAFKEVILIAPDIDSEIFRVRTAPKLVGKHARLTLYSSAQDKALMASKEFHSYSRAGDSGAGLVVMDGIETIDATSVSSDFLGHSYYAEGRIMSDLFYLIRDGKRASERFGLVEMNSGKGRYWVFRR